MLGISLFFQILSWYVLYFVFQLPVLALLQITNMFYFMDKLMNQVTMLFAIKICYTYIPVEIHTVRLFITISCYCCLVIYFYHWYSWFVTTISVFVVFYQMFTIASNKNFKKETAAFIFYCKVCLVWYITTLTNLSDEINLK